VQYFDKKKIKFEYKTFNNYADASLYLENKISKETDDIVEITVKDYIVLSAHIRNKLKGYKTGVDFEKQAVDFDPYIIGLWLGDGTSTKSEITNQDSSILLYLRNQLKKYNLNLQHAQDYTYRIICDVSQNTRKSMNSFMNVLKKYNLINNKHIPYEYKINDRESRLKLLAGLLDTDGYYNKTMKNYEIIQKSKQLSDDILFLARSLGFGCYQYKINKSCKYKGESRTGEYYRIQIYGDNLNDIPVLCPRKKYIDDGNVRQKNALVYGISVKHIGRDNYYGFTLDGNNRFILGDFTVTHNTSIIKEGIAKAMDKPFIFISLGGATDSSFLDGHSYTYEGSIYGRIAQALIDAKCMNPIIYFDELDKVSRCHKGDEIINMLIHLVDPAQNQLFRDKYFYNVDIDLSKVTFIFSFNDPSEVNYILRDRITMIETKYLTNAMKLHIGMNYLLPEILKDVGIKNDDIIISSDIMTDIINSYTDEGGVRKLKKQLYRIVRELNHLSLTDKKINFPIILTMDKYNEIFKGITKVNHMTVHKEDGVGMVNGMWANSMGCGGVLPIESVLIPGKEKMEYKATGMLGKVIKESIEVALSVAWNILSDSMKDTWMERWKTKPECFHLHCPDGSTDKDGPSAGAAMTLAFYSRLTNKMVRHNVAMTGEINLRGEVTAIGGLDEKLNAAKRAGAVLALIPRENAVNLDNVVKNNPTLIDSDFRVECVDTIYDVIKFALC